MLTNRYYWLKELAKLRNYQMGNLSNEYLYIYCTTIRSMWSKKVTNDLLTRMNGMLDSPIEDSKVQEILNRVDREEPPRRFRNQSIISRLHIAPEEVEVLKIGINQKKIEERIHRKQEKLTLMNALESEFARGMTTGEICKLHPDIGKRRIQRYLAAIRKEAQSKAEKETLKETMLTLYQSGAKEVGIARRTGSTVEEVRRTLDLSPMTDFTKLDEYRIKEALPEYVDAGCGKLLSSYNTESVQSGCVDNTELIPDLITSSENIFIQGAAGTGKTVMIQKYLSSLSPQERSHTLIVAPTGKAADHLGGQTIHKAFHLSNDVQPDMEVSSVPVELLSINRLIIDEVNMVRMDIFTAVVNMLRYIEQREHKHIQVIVMGDFGQIQPVATKKDYEILKLHYPNFKGVYAFQSRAWSQLHFRKIVLKKIYRQSDSTFIEKLTEIKYGKHSALQWFNDNANHVCLDGAIYICPTNKLVEKYNAAALMYFSQSKFTEYNAIATEKIENYELPCPKSLLLTTGLRVMTICNAKQYKNGSMGTIIKTNPKSIIIRFDNGETAKVAYRRFELTDGVFYSQIPVVLAYAITANKAEGMTFENINVFPGYFAPGQLYTALSRCTTLSGLHILGYLSASDLRVDLEALKMTLDDNAAS